MVGQIVQTKLVIQAVSRGFKDVDKQLESINKRLDKTDVAGKKGSQGISALGGAFGGLGSVLATLGLGVTIKQLGEFAFESTMLAARVETLGIVTQTLGKNAGYTASEIDALEKAIQKEGITTQASRQSLALMMQAQLDLADSTDLARLAQDAAVIAGVNSSEAFQRLINVITTGNVRMARTMGLQVNFNQGYEDLAVRLGITADELTATEKAQERTNIVMAEGAQIAGAYTAAMGSVGKQVTSTPRYWEEFKVAFGKANIETVGKANTAWQGWLKTQTEALNAVTATTEAEKMGVITSERAAEVRYQLSQGQLDEGFIIKWLTDVMDTHTVAVEQAILADSILLGIQGELPSAIDDVAQSYDSASTTIKKFTKAAIGWQILDKMLQDFQSTTSQEGLLISDAEQAALLNTADIYGITLPEAFQTFVDSAGDAQQAALNLAGDYYASFNFGIDFDTSAPKQKSTYVPPSIGGGGGRGGGESEYARGGVLGNGVSTVGEQGWEFVIGNTVIPHGMSKELSRLGLKAGQAFGFGGAIDIDLPPLPYKKIPGGGMGSASKSYWESQGVSMESYGGTFPGSAGGKGGSAQMETAAVTALTEAVTSSVSTSVAQTQLIAEKISTSTTREISRGNKEMADLMRINNALLARLATAEEIIVGMSLSVGELL